MRALGAILGGIGDLIFGRLTLFALLNLAIAIALTGGAAYSLIRYIRPLIPEGSGWLSYASSAGEIAASVVLLIVAIALSPAVSMLVGGFLFDFAAERVEKAIGAPKARTPPLSEGIANGLKIALPALVLNLVVIPLYFIPGVNVAVFFLLNGALMGREYATLAAARQMSFRQAVTLRNRHGISVFLVGLACSVVPFFAPLVGASAMVRLVNNLPRPDAAGRK
ncbi:EI24 domain-containing protein [Hyphomonas sp. WL0036]|uniref:EI24 domain-containing protein n=1 Tax=Hyphomonas sediminis TaxID=2866160 RepID=UPI001C80F053|nr:EI24 domain-containing protein [Hyphomonas sediminis]MBY9065816.1 EI24 domain-containing protein [Hyphomonas sediminis]